MDMVNRLLNGADDATVDEHGIASKAYIIVATLIFAFVAIQFLFPCNAVMPLDRRTTAVLGSVLCYITRTFLFNIMVENGDSFLLGAIDFNVLVLLGSIMIINHL